LKAKPLQGRKTFKVERLSPLKGLLNFIYDLIPRLTPWAINISPLTGLRKYIASHGVEEIYRP
jgi:hypothetical protein